MAKMGKTYTQFYATFQDGYCVEKGEWHNVCQYMNGLGKRYYRKEADAKADIVRLIKQRNRDFTYNADGKREQFTDSTNGLGVSMKLDKKMDDLFRVLRWKLQRREVTEWEEVEAQEI